LCIHSCSTLHNNQFLKISAAIKSLRSFVVYAVSSDMSLKKRHESIRAFQREDKRAKVFLVTMRIGNCGITLTAATRVYLMEPCVDPATEIQAAGRIHRLGQLRDVFVKRFAFRESYEERVCQLHDEIRAGKAVAVVNGKVSAATIKKLVNSDWSKRKV
jgi:SWI/SNF-related matrix-associated actin-dependent regulator of chromatin subfamily A3